MKNLLVVLFFVFSVSLLQAQSNVIKGKLTHMGVPLVNAEISIDSKASIKTGLDGSYSINAKIGDVIVYSYPSLETINIIVEDVTSILNIELSQEVTTLDEVVVKGSLRKSQKELEEEYGYNKNLIRTAWGILDSETSAGRMRFLQKDEINSVGICILDLLRNQFSGITTYGDCQNGGSVIIRGSASINKKQNAIFDVDGQLFTNVPIWILPAAMERIAVLNSLSLTARYGSIASGGVVVINTIASNYNFASDKIIDRARLRNNKYSNDALDNVEASKNLPSYLTELNNSIDLDSAKEIFNVNKKVYTNSPYFFIDSYAYFVKKGASNYAKQIIKDKIELFETNPVYAKALAYNLEAAGETQFANDIYEQIFILRPSYGQSYRDLAESYRGIGNVQKAAAMYARHNYLVEENFLKKDSTGIYSIMDRESENLLALEGDRILEGAKPENRAMKYTEFDGTRFLFEWNDSEAEFELQFVNPENHFYTWKHTMQENASRITDEKRKGYSCEEFLVDNSLPGRWKINVNYKGNKKLEPSYLKVTTYYNYGETSQRKEVNVYRLGLKNRNLQLFNLNNSSAVVSAN